MITGRRPAPRAKPRKAPAASTAATPRAPTAGWWGDGPSPLERWPGTTIEIPAVWVPARARWESPDSRYYYDQDAADRAVEFFPTFLSHHMGEFAGRPFTLLDYQQLLLTRPIFGWKRARDGRRRFRKVFAFLPKGAGKSPWGAGTGLYLTLCDQEPAAEVYAVAADREQGRVVHTNAKIMVEESSDLAEMCEILKDAIYCAATRSTYKVLSSDASTKHGFRPHGVIFDEFHAQPNRNLYEALSKSMVKRRQPLMVIVSHSGDNDEGICFEEYELAKRVMSGTLPDDTFLPVIFEAAASDDWTLPEVWRKANPGHGITVQAEAIAAECEAAKAEPRKLNDFLRFHLNRWVNQATAWIPVDWWDACPSLPGDEILRELPVFAGLDMSQKYDLTAFVLAFLEPMAATTDAPAPAIEVVDVADEPSPGAAAAPIKRVVSLNFQLSLVPFFWLPEETLRERVKQDRVPYDEWQRKGLLRVTEGNVIDYDVILQQITGEITARFPRLKGAPIGYDPAFATDIALKLGAAGYQPVEILQNYKHMNEPANVLEALIKGKRVRHDGHRVLRWNWENVAIKKDDAGRIRPVKPRRQAKRIDGVVASLMATGRAVLNAAAAPAPRVHLFQDDTTEDGAAPRPDDALTDDGWEDERWDE